MPSVLAYNVNNQENKANSFNEKVCPKINHKHLWHRSVNNTIFWFCYSLGPKPHTLPKWYIQSISWSTRCKGLSSVSGREILLFFTSTRTTNNVPCKSFRGGLSDCIMYYDLLHLILPTILSDWSLSRWAFLPPWNRRPLQLPLPVWPIQKQYTWPQWTNLCAMSCQILLQSTRNSHSLNLPSSNNVQFCDFIEF